MSHIGFRGFRHPPDIIRRAAWLYLRFTPGLRDVEGHFAGRGVDVTCETVRCRVGRFGPQVAKRVRSARPMPTSRRRPGEMFVSIGGRQMYLWRAVGDEGEVLDVPATARRDKLSALRLMRKSPGKHGVPPTAAVTDRHRACAAGFNEPGLRVDHVRDKRANNRMESPHVPARRRERKRQGFKSARPAQRFVSMHAATCDPFDIGRHLIAARTNRRFRAAATASWRLAAPSKA